MTGGCQFNCGCYYPYPECLDEGVDVVWPDYGYVEGYGQYRTTAYAQWCKSCAYKWEIEGNLILNAKEETEWLDGCPVRQKWKQLELEEKNIQLSKKQMFCDLIDLVCIANITPEYRKELGDRLKKIVMERVIIKDIKND